MFIYAKPFLFASVLILSACGGGDGDSTTGGQTTTNELVTSQTVKDLLLNGIVDGEVFDLEDIDTIWVCSTRNATRGFGLVFLDEPDSRDTGFYYTASAVNEAFFWSISDSGDIRLSATLSGGSIVSPQFSGTSVFTSEDVVFFRNSSGPTTCIKEDYVRPVVIG